MKTRSPFYSTMNSLIISDLMSQEIPPGISRSGLNYINSEKPAPKFTMCKRKNSCTLIDFADSDEVSELFKEWEYLHSSKHALLS